MYPNEVLSYQSTLHLLNEVRNCGSGWIRNPCATVTWMAACTHQEQNSLERWKERKKGKEGGREGERKKEKGEEEKEKKKVWLV